MARPIKETPILYGVDAERFVREMERVESLSSEERAENTAQLRRDYNEAIRHIAICL